MRLPNHVNAGRYFFLCLLLALFRHAAPCSARRLAALHHMMARGLEQRTIFPDDTDREEFLARLATLVPETQTACYAWVLMPTHVPLLLRTGVCAPSCLPCLALGLIVPARPLRRPAGLPAGIVRGRKSLSFVPRLR